MLTYQNDTQEKARVQANYNALAQKYIHNYIQPKSLFGLEKQQRLKIAQHYLRGVQPLSVLDLGCGPGYTTSKVASDLANATVIGVDFSAEMVHFANNNYAKQASFLQGDAEKLPFVSEQFSTVFALGVLDKFKTPHLLLCECHRVLKPKGFLLFTYPNASSLNRAFQRWFVSLQGTDKEIQNLQFLSIETLKCIVHQIGFKLMTMLFITYGNGIMMLPWSKIINSTMEKCCGQRKIGQTISMTTFWIVQKRGQ